MQEAVESVVVGPLPEPEEAGRAIVIGGDSGLRRNGDAILDADGGHALDVEVLGERDEDLDELAHGRQGEAHAPG